MKDSLPAVKYKKAATEKVLKVFEVFHGAQG